MSQVRVSQATRQVLARARANRQLTAAVKKLPGFTRAVRYLRNRQRTGSFLERLLPQVAVDATGQSVAELRQVSWTPDGMLQITGWAFRRGTISEPRLEMLAVNDSDHLVVPVTLNQPGMEEVNRFAADGDTDRSSAGFVAWLDPADLLSVGNHTGIFQRTWRLWIVVGDEQGRVITRLKKRHQSGSATQLTANDIGDGCLLRPTWHDRKGLSVVLARRDLVLTDATATTDGFRLEIDSRGSQPFDSALMTSATGSEVKPSLRRLETGGYLVEIRSGALSAVPADQTDQRWFLFLERADGARSRVYWQGPDGGGQVLARSDDKTTAIRCGGSGIVRIDVTPSEFLIDEVEVIRSATPVLRFVGSLHGVADPQPQIMLHGTRRQFPAVVIDAADGRLTFDVSLIQPAPWTDQQTPIESGEYSLLLQSADGPGSTNELLASVSPLMAQRLDRRYFLPELNLTLGCTTDRTFTLLVDPPLADRDAGRFHRRRIHREYRARAASQAEAVVYESFSGRTASCNTLAIHNELLRRRPDLLRYWAVTDLSVAVPDGATKLIIQSPAYWAAMADARYIVSNTWITGTYLHRSHQRVLQAWHGTPLKTLGLDRPGAADEPGYAEQLARTVQKWDLLVSQNPHSSAVFKRAYGYQNEILEIGYPRDDILGGEPDRELINLLRSRLGLGESERVILYVPTWREDHSGLFRELDFAQLLDGIGSGYRLLVRGHSRTLRQDRDVEVPGVLDVTAYPEVSELLLITDILITDYSSIMFDYSITGRPMLFFVPDIDRYESELRGTYFSLREQAPGPLLTRTGEVVEAVRSIEEVQRTFAGSYASWRSEFNPFDDGSAARRAVERLLDE